MDYESGIIIYNTPDGRSKVALMARDGKVWLNQQSIAELFGTSKQNVSRHIANILNDNELKREAVVKDYLTTATDGKPYHVLFYSLEMILAGRSTMLFKQNKMISKSWRHGLRVQGHNCMQRLQYTGTNYDEVKQLCGDKVLEDDGRLRVEKQ